MKTQEKQTTLRIIEADDKKWLTQAVTPKELYKVVFAKKIYLAANDDQKNWKEITDKEKKNLEEKIKLEKEKIEKKL